MKNIRIFTLAVMFCLVSCLTATAQNQPKTFETREDAKKNSGGGITFKVPDKVMGMQWAGFKGLLMLYPNRPAGIFVSYPNNDESLEKLAVRAEKSLANMFIHDEKKSENIVWQTKTIPAHQGDRGTTATMKTYDDETQTLQITLYEREWNNYKLIYGYFARKSKTSKDKEDSGDFLDEKGQGSKQFDEFWKTFPGK